MDCVFLDLNISVSPAEARHQFIVISRDVNYTCPFAGLAQNFLDHVVMFLWPVNRAPQRPDVDQVAHDVERIGISLAEKIQKCGGVAATRAQVGVGYPRGAIALWS